MILLGVAREFPGCPDLLGKDVSVAGMPGDLGHHAQKMNRKLTRPSRRYLSSGSTHLAWLSLRRNSLRHTRYRVRGAAKRRRDGRTCGMNPGSTSAMPAVVPMRRRLSTG